jgi:hypothetical protein
MLDDSERNAALLKGIESMRLTVKVHQWPFI